jgi:uncharacterized coiled-coil protein SlyX
MNENLEDKKKDIKPVRPEASSKKGSRRIKGGGFLFSSILTILNLVGLIVLFLWFFNTSGNQQQAGQNFIERISNLEESYDQQVDTIKDLNQNLDSELTFVNKEVRKLWDLSNKRNRKNITENLNSIEDLSVKIDDLIKINKTLSAKQRALSLELAKIAKIQEKTNQTMQDVNQVASKATSEDLRDIQDTLDSFNAYRLQVNKSLITMKEKINQLELVALDTSNE